MERAGAGLAQTVSRVYREGRIAVVVGKGNNGGDGLVAARRLRELGREVEVLMLAAADELRGDARSNYERLPGQAPIPFTAAALEGAAVIVDAILGTGFSGRPREPLRSAIEAIDQARRDGAVVAACDVASGVDASTGEVIGPAVTADLTVTFHAAKPGHWVAPGKAHAGELVIVDIGIGEGAPVAPEIGLIDDAVLEQAPRRGRESTKFAAGAVLVCGGSLGLTGAPSLASEAAQRAGAGYVTALIPRSLNLVFEQRLLEAMSVPLPDRGWRDHRRGARRGSAALRARRRARARSRNRAGTVDPGVRARGRDAGADCAAAGRRRAVRVLRPSGRSGQARRPRRADAARRRAWSAAGARVGRDRGAPARGSARGRGHGGGGRGAQGRRHDRRAPTAAPRSAAAGPRRWRRPAPATCCRALSARFCPSEWSRSPPPARACCCTPQRDAWRRPRSATRA